MKRKSIELIAFDKNQNLQYEGNCRLIVNRVSSMLLIEPKKEEFKMISVMFKWNFVMDKNILFIFAENEVNDCVLVFNSENQCSQIFDFICKDKVQTVVEKEMFFKRFWNPLCVKFHQNQTSTTELKKIIKEWIGNVENSEKEKYMNFLKDKNIYDFVYSGITSSNNNERGIDASSKGKTNVIRNERKRNRSEVNIMSKSSNVNKIRIQSQKQKESNKFKEIVHSPLFKIVNVKKGKNYRRRLLIFDTPEKLDCYEYFLKQGQYYCIGCKNKSIEAIIVQNENGVEYVKLDVRKHVCSPIPYSPEKHIEIQIIKKPNYDILENCNTFFGKLLILFDENDRNRCWEFRLLPLEQKFICRRCNSIAKIWNKNCDDEYIELRTANHQCESVLFDKKSYYSFNDFVLSSDFKVHEMTFKNGKNKKRMFIFDKTNKNLCYIYSFLEKKDIFYCSGCMSKKVRVYAKLLQNAEGEDYVVLSKVKHICQLQPYQNLLKQEIILRSSNFELMENTSSGRNKIFVFDGPEKSLCYTFTHFKLHKNTYYCINCRWAVNDDDQKKNSKIGKYLSAELCKDQNGESFLRMTDSKHICQARKYQPEKYAKKVPQKCFDYFFYRPKTLKNSIFVGIYHPKDRTLCFRLTYWEYVASFRCPDCLRKGKTWRIKIEKDENGKEFFDHDVQKHLCEPIKVSSIKTPKYVMLKRNEINLKFKENKIDESRIIKAPNFKLGPNKKGVADADLFIYDSVDRNLGYRYSFWQSTEVFKCYQRTLCKSTARLQIQENGEKFILLGKNIHKCEPIIYESFQRKKEKIINSCDFITISKNNENKITTVIVFTTKNRDECYEFSTTTSADIFRCLGCLPLHKYFTVKLDKDENGQDILETLRQDDHVCTPRKYLKEKFKPKILKKIYNFELFPNTKGEPNKRLIVFTSERKDLCYTLGWTSGKSYRCCPCGTKKTCVMAKICEDEAGLKYVECGPREHVCKPRKYETIK